MSVLTTNKLTKYYSSTRGIENLTFTVEEGEIFGFLGPNGAGKTTTIRTLLGFQSPTEGSATVLGANITDANALRSARSRIGFLPSDPTFDEDVTGERLLKYHASLQGDSRSEELLELFNPPLEREVGEYSRGNQQMLAIIIAFMHDPDLVIMDEPTSGLDPLKQENFLKFIHEEKMRGKTIFFSSHILSEVRKVCDRVGIIRDGYLVELENIEELLDRNGKMVSARFSGRVEAKNFKFEGVHDLEVDNDINRDNAERTSTTVSFTYTGAYEALLEKILEYEILELNIEEAPLEDVFMRFYGDIDVGELDKHRQTEAHV